MSEISPHDRDLAESITTEWETSGEGYAHLDDLIAQALADERVRAHETGLPNNPDPGNVAFRVEAWPHDPGANGEEYVSGHMPAAEAAKWLRDIADRCGTYWGDPECPWDGQPGHLPERPETDQREAEERKDAAYARRIAEGKE